VGCLRRRSSSGADQAKGVPACFVSVKAAAKQRRLRAKGGVSAFAPTLSSPTRSLSGARYRCYLRTPLSLPMRGPFGHQMQTVRLVGRNPSLYARSRTVRPSLTDRSAVRCELSGSSAETLAFASGRGPFDPLSRIVHASSESTAAGTHRSD
jgi:hypothetical protein